MGYVNLLEGIYYQFWELPVFHLFLQHLRTTLVRHCAKWLQHRGYRVRGFVTDEVRKSGRRGGFDVVAMGNLGMASGGGLEQGSCKLPDFHGGIKKNYTNVW